MSFACLILKCLYTSRHCQKLKLLKKCHDIILFVFACWNLPSMGPRFVNIHPSVDKVIINIVIEWKGINGCRVCMCLETSDSR